MKKAAMEDAITAAKFKPVTVRTAMNFGRVGALVALSCRGGRLHVHAGADDWRLDVPLPAWCSGWESAGYLLLPRRFVARLKGRYSRLGTKLMTAGETLCASEVTYSKRVPTDQPWRAFTGVDDKHVERPSAWYDPTHHGNLRWAHRAACADSGRPNLWGAMAAARPPALSSRLGGRVWFTTDGHRLHVVRLVLAGDGDRLPYTSMSAVAKWGASRINVGPEWCHTLLPGGGLLTERIHKSKAPPLDQVIRDSERGGFKLSRGLLHKVEPLHKLRRGHQQDVVVFRKDGASVHATFLSDISSAPDLKVDLGAIPGSREVTVPTKWAVRCRYLLEAGPGRLALSGELDCGLLRAGPTRYAAIMPMRT